MSIYYKYINIETHYLDCVKDEMTQHYRTIWISDIHLGTKGCSAVELLNFLKHTESETLFLVGDIIDMWQLRKRWYWPAIHNEVVQKILRKSRKGTEVIYIPGNHDETVRDFLPLMVGDIRVEREYEYRTVLGETLLITHGDLYDIITQYHKWLAVLGDVGYTTMLEVSRAFNWTRRKLGMGYWSLSAFLKQRVKEAASFICKFEESLATECKQRSCDGVVAGHIHHAEMRMIDGVRYLNDGDWVESKTALAEQHDGTFVILSWQDDQLVELARWEPSQPSITHAKPKILDL